MNVRIIAATNRSLQRDVDAGKFREDLFYRLNVFTITLPSLNERKEDIPALASHYLALFAAKTNSRLTGMNTDFLQQLQQHSWKGNIRELKNIIERAVILSEGTELTTDNLPLEFQQSSPVTDSGNSLSAFSLASMEKLHIQRVLNHTSGNKTEAAKLLNIGLTTLYRKIEEYHIV